MKNRGMNPIAAALLQQLFSPGESLGDLMGLTSQLAQQQIQGREQQRSDESHGLNMQVGKLSLDDVITSRGEKAKESKLNRKKTKQELKHSEADESRKTAADMHARSLRPYDILDRVTGLTIGAQSAAANRSLAQDRTKEKAALVDMEKLQMAQQLLSMGQQLPPELQAVMDSIKANPQNIKAIQRVQ